MKLNSTLSKAIDLSLSISSFKLGNHFKLVRKIKLCNRLGLIDSLPPDLIAQSGVWFAFQYILEQMRHYTGCLVWQRVVAASFLCLLFTNAYKSYSDFDPKILFFTAYFQTRKPHFYQLYGIGDYKSLVKTSSAPFK